MPKSSPAHKKSLRSSDTLPQEAALAPLAGGLYLVSVPIGNLGDITLRALDVLKRADRLVCEDTRAARRLLTHYGIVAMKAGAGTGEGGSRLSSYHDANADKVREKLLTRLDAGESLALLAEAGTPLISDPGYKLVREAIKAGHVVTALPGATAFVPALQLSGLPSDRFAFLGFLPPKSAARRRALAPYAALPVSLILYEAPSRLAASLADLAEILGPARPAAVARELTKLFEQIRRDSLGNLAAFYKAEGPPKGELAIVIGRAPEETAPDQELLTQLLEEALARTSLKAAVTEVTALTGLARKDVYSLALELKGKRPEDRR